MVIGPALLLLFGFAVLWIAGMVFWIVKLVEVAQIPDPQFTAAGQSKVVWILIVVLLGAVGALVWQFAARDGVLAAAGRFSGPPAWPFGTPPPSGWQNGTGPGEPGWYGAAPRPPGVTGWPGEQPQASPPQDPQQPAAG